MGNISNRIMEIINLMLNNKDTVAIFHVFFLSSAHAAGEYMRQQ